MYNDELNQRKANQFEFLQFVIQKSINQTKAQTPYLSKTKQMDKLKALRQKLKKGIQEKPQQELKQQLPPVELGYNNSEKHQESHCAKKQQQSHLPQTQQQQNKFIHEVKQQIRYGYQIKHQENQQEQHGVEHGKHESIIEDQGSKIIQEPMINQQSVQVPKSQNEIIYGYQKMEDLRIIQSHSDQDKLILEEPIKEHKHQLSHQQKPQQQLQTTQIGYNQTQLTPPVKLPAQQLVATSQTLEQKKKSKMDMLRQKIRLKKLTQNQTQSNKSIPQQPKPQQTKPQDLGYQNITQQKEQIININQNRTQNLGYKDISEDLDKSEDNHGSKKNHIDPVKQAVIFQNMRQDRIPLGYNHQNNQQIQAEDHLQQQAQKSNLPIEIQHQSQGNQNQINPQKPIVLANSHTLFYQLNQLQEYLRLQPSQQQKPSKENNNIKEFVKQLSKFKENINRLNNSF